MRFPALIGIACVLVAACGRTDDAAVARLDGLPIWALDPGDPGSDIPAAGRSLFDFAMAAGNAGTAAYEIPDTFEQLVRRIETRVGCAADCSRRVLIPLGRSLQRSAASPDFFVAPRVVVAITGEGAGPLSGRDRIYLGYQPRAGLIEVISYNEAAGRFEFQLVKDYRPGATPKLVYAQRGVCIACHQNHGPLFSRQVWDETNANPEVAELLSRGNHAFRRIPVEVPNAIDDATDRANLIGVTQRLWTEACDPRCRAAALTAALQYRLSGGRSFEREPVALAIAGGFRKRWPDGLAIPNPDIPNRNPVDSSAGASGLALAHVPAGLEPLAPRAPLAIWRAGDAELTDRLVTGIAQILAAADVQEIADLLAGGAAAAATVEYRAACTVTAAGSYDCRGEVSLRGNAAALDSIAIGSGGPLRNLGLAPARRTPGSIEFQPGRRFPRLADGNAIGRVALQWRGARGEATITVKQDFAPLRAAITGMSLSDRPISRTGVMAALDAALGRRAQERCCDDASALPAPQVQAAASSALLSKAAAFKEPCGACHATAESSPPNFLSGDAERINSSLAHCAPRLFVRLAMWDLPAGARAKVPMPPPQASRAGHPWMQEAPADSIRPLRNAVSEWLRAETGEMPDVAKLLSRGYENLRPCLPAGA